MKKPKNRLSALASAFGKKLLLCTFCASIILSFLSSCGTKNISNIPPEEIDEEELCYIQFYKINNEAKIYIDDELKVDSGPIGEQENSEIEMPLTKYLDKGKHKIKVELINGEGLASDSYDEYWEIYYELFLKGVPIDYMHEKNDHSDEYGVVWSYTHEITIN